MAVTTAQLIEGFRRRHNREPDRSEREQILTAAFESQYNRLPTDEQKAAIKRAAAAPFPGPGGGYSVVQQDRPALVDGAPPLMVERDPATGQNVQDFGVMRVQAPPVSPVRLRKPHRKLYAGGAFQDTLDFLSTGSRMSAAGAGALFRPAGGGYLERYRDPDTSYGELLDEVAPNADRTWYGRLGTGLVGFLGDVALDPSTYVAVGALGKLGKVAQEGTGLVKALAEVGVAALDPVGTALKPVGALARKIPGVSGVLANIAERTATRNEVRAILREERRATGAKAARTVRTAQELKDAAAVVSRRATAAAPDDVRAGVGRVLDAGYDAAQAAKKAETAAQAAALKKARRELTIPARTKAARSEGRLQATRQAESGAAALLEQTKRRATQAADEVAEMSRARGEVAGRLKGLTERKLGRREGRGGQTSQAAINKHVDLSDRLVASDARIEALERQIRAQEETIGRTRVQRQNVKAENRAIKEEADARMQKAYDELGEDGYWNTVYELDTLRLHEEDPGSGIALARALRNKTHDRPMFRSMDRKGRYGAKPVESVSIADMSEEELRALRGFLDEYLPAGEGRYATTDTFGRVKKKPTVIQQGEHAQYDVAIPKVEVERALANYEASMRAQEAHLREAIAGGERVPRATAQGVNAESRVAREAVSKMRAQHAVELAENRKLAREFAARNSRLARDFKALGMDGTEAEAALKEHAALTLRLNGATSRLRTLNQTASQQASEAARLALRAEKLEPVVAARKRAVAEARHVLTSPAAKAERRAAVAEAGEAAKHPAMEAEVRRLQESLGLTPEGETGLRGILSTVQQAGNESGEALAEAGVLKPSTVAANRDVYAKRLYERNVDPDAYLQSLRDDPLAFLWEEAEQAGAFRGGGGANPMARAAKRRKDLDQETREGLGQIEDILPRFLRGEAESGAAVARAHTLNALAMRMAVPELSEEAAAASVSQAASGGLGRMADLLGLTPNRMVQAPDMARYGPLRNQFLPHEALQAFDRSIAPTRFISTNRLADAGLKLYDRGLSTWKAAMVPFNPPTRLANRASNYLRAYNELGVDPVTWLRYSSAAARDIRGEGAWASGLHGLQRVLGREVPRAKPGPLYNLAMETDPVFHGGLMGGYDEAIRALRPGGGNWLANAIRTGLDYVGTGYGKAETTDKLGIFKLMLDRGATPAEAAEAARRTLFDYGEAPYITDLLSKTVMPFARYPFLALPAEAASFRARPDRYATLAKALLALQREGDDSEGTRGYEEQTVSGYLRDNATIRMPWKDGAGRSVHLDITRFLPAGNAMSLGSSVASLNPLRGNPFLSLLTDVTANRDTFTGRDLTNPDLPLSYRMRDVGGHVLGGLVPSVAPGGTYWNQAARAVRGDLDHDGVPYPVGEALARYGFGLTFRPMTAERNVELRAMEIDRMERALNAAINRKGRAGRDVTRDVQNAEGALQEAVGRFERETAR